MELVHEGRVAAIMKGHLHTDALLRHVVKSQGGLRGTRRISHVFVMDAPTLPQLVLVTDAAINIAPTLKEKVDIVQNAIDLALALGIAQPRVGILCAVETVNPDMPSTLDAAALSKMAERGTDPWRPRRRPAGDGQRDQPDRRRTKGLDLAGRRAVRHPRRSESWKPATSLRSN